MINTQIVMEIYERCRDTYLAAVDADCVEVFEQDLRRYMCMRREEEYYFLVLRLLKEHAA